MKKSLYSLLFVMFILPINVKAATGNLSISCADTTLKSGESTTCTIAGNSDVDIIDISTIIELSDNLVMESLTLDEKWEGSDFDTGKIDIYTKSGDTIKGSFTVGVMKIKVKNNIVNTNENVSLTDIEFTKDAKEYVVSNASCNIRVPNNVNLLSSLNVNGATFLFDENTTTYDLIVDSESTTINVIKKDDKSIVTGDTGSKKLKYGVNKFTVTVAAEDGSKRNYILNITRPDNRNKENNLLSFEFIDYDIKFNKNTTIYNLTVDNDINKIVFSSSCSANSLCINSSTISFSEKTNNKVIFNNSNYNINEFNSNLNVGNNILKIVVIAENGEEKIYSFNINRKNRKGNLIDEEIDTNSQTGDSSIIIVCVLAVLAAVTAIYFYMKRNKANL